MFFESPRQDVVLNIAAIVFKSSFPVSMYLLSLHCRIPYQLCTVKMLCSFLSRVCYLT